MSRAKHSLDSWRFDYIPKLERWETWRPVSDWPADLIRWLWTTFGHPGTDPDTGKRGTWDYHGGWIYFYNKECVALFKLTW